MLNFLNVFLSCVIISVYSPVCQDVYDATECEITFSDMRAYKSEYGSTVVGISGDLYPKYEERYIQHFWNLVRFDCWQYVDLGYEFGYNNLRGVICDDERYIPCGPVWYHPRYVEAARFHCEDLLYNCQILQHSSCDGTWWSIRVNSFTQPAVRADAEIASGSNDLPDSYRRNVDRWLCEQWSTANCRWGGHTQTTLGKHIDGRPSAYRLAGAGVAATEYIAGDWGFGVSSHPPVNLWERDELPIPSGIWRTEAGGDQEFLVFFFSDTLTSISGRLIVLNGAGAGTYSLTKDMSAGINHTNPESKGHYRTVVNSVSTSCTDKFYFEFTANNGSIPMTFQYPVAGSLYIGVGCSPDYEVRGSCTPPCSSHGTCQGLSCECDDGWTGTTCDTEEEICSPPCVNGDCVSDVCECDEYWGGEDCSTRLCNPVCINGLCSQSVTNLCDCTDGWGGTACDQPECPAGCVNGNCIAPDTCECDPGWGSAACDVPDCTTNGCVHGTCTLPDTCVCLPGWTGLDCNTHECVPACQNGGTCSGPNTCDCPEGYGGPTCEEVNCNCVQGTCGVGGPDDCTCNEGWEGTLCDDPICDPDCQNGGTCVAPNDCACVNGWSGASCSLAVCNPMCEHGVCTSPNVCTCMAGWSGDLCEIVECFSKPAAHPQVCSSHGECIGPNTCDCDDDWHGVMCNHEVVPGAICFGVESSDPSVCSARGSCVATDTCECDKGYEGEECEVLISCKGILWNDIANGVCSGNGVCISKNKCWKVDEEGDCTQKNLMSILLLSTLIPAGGVVLICGSVCLLALCILICIKRRKVIEYVEVVRNTMNLKGKKYKEFQDNLPEEEELDDGYDNSRKKRPLPPPKRRGDW